MEECVWWGEKVCSRCLLPIHEKDPCVPRHIAHCSGQEGASAILPKLDGEGTRIKIAELTQDLLPTVVPDPERRIIDVNGRQLTFAKWSEILPAEAPWSTFAARVHSILQAYEGLHLFCSLPLIADTRYFVLLPLATGDRT